MRSPVTTSNPLRGTPSSIETSASPDAMAPSTAAPSTAAAPTAAAPTAAAPLGRRERRKLEVRTRIFSAARELFKKQGFEATTVDEIAALADVAPATFFNHFHSKQAILGLMTQQVVEHLRAMTLESLVGDGSSIDRFRRFIDRATEDISANRDTARETLLEFMRLDATPDGPHPYVERLFQPFVELIAEGQNAGEIRGDHDPVFLTQMSVGMINSAITSWLADPDYPVEQGLVEAMEFAIETLRPTPDVADD